MFAKLRWIAPVFVLVLCLTSFPGMLQAAPRTPPQTTLAVLNVSVSGPPAIALGQQVTYKAYVAGGTGTYNYAWQVRHSTAQGWSEWSLPMRTGTDNSITGAAMTCGVKRAELRATVMDAFGSMGTGSIIIDILNPC